MIKRTIIINSPSYLSLCNSQIQIVRKDKHIRTEPLEDIGFLLLDHAQITISLPLLNALRANNTAVIFCDELHHPRSMLLNLDGNTLQNELFRAQISASTPLKKNIWKQVVMAKLRNQAAVLAFTGSDGKDIESMAAQVKSGDSDNREGYAARLYWPRLFGYDFKRLREGLPPNNMLNYGYAIIRAAVARALAASGLLNTLGIHHSNRYNAFCLADDMMEPYRPFADAAVWELYRICGDVEEIDTDIKRELLSMLHSDCHCGKEKRPLMLAMQASAASLAQCFNGTLRNVEFPAFLE
ncbi:MAG: type II CRISPR-associated endonuclease Cas1 [Actinomycetota bacterium]|nr:type II CRISPR-associated endonuclease Cas1 [Actinomycetota bacterium]